MVMEAPRRGGKDGWRETLCRARGCVLTTRDRMALAPRRRAHCLDVMMFRECVTFAPRRQEGVMSLSCPASGRRTLSGNRARMLVCM